MSSGKMEQKDDYNIFQWTLMHSDGVIIIYKNLTADCILQEELFIQQQGLIVTEPEGISASDYINVIVEPQGQFTVKLENIADRYSFGHRSQYRVTRLP